MTGSPRAATMQDGGTEVRPAGGSSVGWRRSPRMAGLIVVAMNRLPAADVEVSADLVRRLLADQHPDLARLPVAFLANGWDNELYRVGDGLVARLPGAPSARRSSRMSSAGCPSSPQGCPCPSLIRTNPGTSARLPLLLERGALPAGRARSGGHLLRPGQGRGRRRPVPRRAAHPRSRMRRPTRSGASRWPSAPAASRPTSPCSLAKAARIKSTGTRCCARGTRRSRPPATTVRLSGCTAICTRRTFW